MRARGILFLSLFVVTAQAPPAFAAEPGLEAFLGTREGRWDDRVNTTLVVEKIEGTKALVTYRRDGYPRLRLAPIDVKATGRFLDNTTLKVTSPGRGPITYVLTPAGSLAAETISSDGSVARATMRKQ